MSSELVQTIPPPSVAPTAAEINLVRQRAGKTADLLGDADISTIIQHWWFDTGDKDASGVEIAAWDLWAASATVLEAWEMGLVGGKEFGATAVNLGDISLSWSRTGGAAAALRGIIRRYWKRSDALNRELGMPSNWQTLDIDTQGTYRLAGWPWPFVGEVPVVNGPTPFP